MSVHETEQREERREKRDQSFEVRKEKERQWQDSVFETVSGYGEDEDSRNSSNVTGTESGSEVTLEEERPRKRRKRRRPKKRRRESDGGGGGGDSEGSGDDDDGVPAVIPREILKLTAAVAIRMGLSVGQHTALTAAFVRACGADLDDFPLSVSTAHRMRKEVLEDKYDESRSRFKEAAEADRFPLIVHVDGTQLANTFGPEGSRVTNKTERLAVVVTSAMYEGEVFAVSYNTSDAADE